MADQPGSQGAQDGHTALGARLEGAKAEGNEAYKRQDWKLAMQVR